MATGDLTFRQRMFIAAYLGKANGNATEAARIAGYAHPNPQGARLLANVSIRAAIEARVSTAGLEANEVLARVADIACGDMADFITVNAKGQPSINLNKAKKAGKLRLIRSLKPGRDGVKIELRDPLAALIQLGKYHGLWDGDKVPRSPDGEPPKRIFLPGRDES